MSSTSVIETDALTRLDNMPWTRFHTTMTVALSVGWALDSFETNIIGSMFGVIKKQWHLSPMQGSLAVTVWLCGMLIGAIGFGYLAERLPGTSFSVSVRCSPGITDHSCSFAL